MAMSSSNAAEKFALLRVRSTRLDNDAAAEARHPATRQKRVMSNPGVDVLPTARLAASEISIDSR